VPLSHTCLRRLHPYTLGMNLMNNIMGEHQALPEEMLTKKTSTVCSAHVVAGVKIL